MADGDSTLPRRQLGRLLHRYRDEVGLSLAQAARLVDIGTTTLHRLEKGQANKVRLGVVQQLCEIYERAPEEIAAARYPAQDGAGRSRQQNVAAENGQGVSGVNGKPSPAQWFKSTFSQSTECVEVAFLEDGAVGVRHSKNPTGPALTFTASEWRAFLAGVRAGEFGRG
ncbi:DUF397 domain-containing protein [Nocardia farcinica]|nr:DUF397 domain-containing protein [Nocardia farcinica]MBF6282749.1 DUF397 domain-containing protein [Nocardia farcinica]MBF6308270.1 DUF397 domain-containing protein [Nocardia farcinica]MBF6391121.1 DUF397 domain-containing protein [Nocardia farcinica]MBF6492498.1 DUF397 domain-containing protein [Nocardia farcinica]